VGVVVGKKGLGDNVGAGREVNESGSNSRRITTLAAAVALRESRVDGFSVIRASITLGAVVLDVAEDLVVGRVTKGNLTLALDGREPPGAGISSRRYRSPVLRSCRGDNSDLSDGDCSLGCSRSRESKEAHGQKGGGDNSREPHDDDEEPAKSLPLRCRVVVSL